MTGIPGQLLLDDELKEAAKSLGIAKVRAAQDAVQFRASSSGGNLAFLCGSRMVGGIVDSSFRAWSPCTFRFEQRQPNYIALETPSVKP